MGHLSRWWPVLFCASKYVMKNLRESKLHSFFVIVLKFLMNGFYRESIEKNYLY
jgi:hypothetical protein